MKIKQKKIVWTAFFAVLIAAALLFTYLLVKDIIILQRAETPDEIIKLKGDIPALKEINPDVVGWVTVDDTNIDFPLLQGDTNMKYVSRDIYGKNCLSGSIFLDSTNALDDPFLLIYGHHMEAGKMFGDIDKYLSESFFNAHQRGELVTGDGKLSIDFFAFLVTETGDDIIFRPQGRTAEEVIEHLNEEALYRHDIKMDGQIIALSTCGREYDNQRYVLIGTISKGEENGQK